MTDHEKAWMKFIETMDSSEMVAVFDHKIITGLPFIYITPAADVTQTMIESLLKLSAATAMKGKRLTLAMSYVRKNQAQYVYRIRFLVPQRKMFCCGNLCDDCIRFTQPS
ncbi:hypothetical protein [Thalassobacillus hwangdonensis]|uniref:Uncharacterized protein n=1 Tax=Thalassobacillus hwangdonensis TaxID=546108 RepID=A0ABW3KYM5_9BACI